MTTTTPQVLTIQTDDEGLLHDDLEQLMDNDKQLQNAYMRAIREIGSEWTDEKIAETAFILLYSENVTDLMAAWRWNQHLTNPSDPLHSYAIAVHHAVLKFNSRKQQATAGV